MKTEGEIRKKINSLRDMQSKAKENMDDGISSDVALQIDMLLWVIGDNSGLPPLDEDEIYSCYQ